MTQFDLNGILYGNNLSESTNKDIRFRLKGHLEILDSQISQMKNKKKDMSADITIEKTKLKMLHFSLKSATYYLIQLFYQTGQRYSCSLTKLGKLLSIVAFVFARQGEQVFDETIYKYNECGTKIKELFFLVDRDIYRKYKYLDEKSEIDSKYIDEDAILPSMYKTISGEIPFKIKTVIDSVFLRFGAYNTMDLGKCIVPIISQNGVIQEDESVDLSIIHTLTRDNFLAYYSDGVSDTALIDYIFENRSKQ